MLLWKPVLGGHCCLDLKETDVHGGMAARLEFCEGLAEVKILGLGRR